MNGYLMHFLIYFLAMTGFIVLALYVYKKTMYMNKRGTAKESYLSVENALRLTPGKVVYVLKAGNERFLIAGDTQRTTMLAKLSATDYENE